MAKKPVVNVAEDLFSTRENDVHDETDAHIRFSKKAGRPKAQDVKDGEKIIKTTVHFTRETLDRIDIYALKNRMDRSEAIRKLIREYAE